MKCLNCDERFTSLLTISYKFCPYCNREFTDTKYNEHFKIMSSSKLTLENVLDFKKNND